MRILIAGQKEFGRAVFNLALAMGIEIAAVAAPAQRDTSKGHRDRLRAAAEDSGVTWIPSGTLNFQTCPDGLDLIVAAHSHDFIGGRTIAKAGLGAIGYHPSLLPIHRGRDAVFWTIHMRDRVSGGSVYWLTENVDAGPICAQRHVFVRPDDTPESLWRRELFPLGLDLFAQVFTDLLAKRLVRIPQESRLATWEPSWQRPPLWRPDLDALGAGGWGGYDVVVA